MPESYFSALGKQSIKEAMDERVRERLDEEAPARRMGALIDEAYERRCA